MQRKRRDAAAVYGFPLTPCHPSFGSYSVSPSYVIINGYDMTLLCKIIFVNSDQTMIIIMYWLIVRVLSIAFGL